MEVEIHDQKNQRDPRVAWEGCSVLLEINDGDRALFARLNLSSTVKIGNKKCSLVPLIGCPFGSLFQLEVGPKGPYLSHISATVAGVGLQENGDCITSNESKDNRALVDDNKAQSLSSEDIDALRREGATGDQIVEALIANSSTFGNKTSFSQEKYRVKKQKKYAPKVLMRRPSGRSICEAYFLKHPAKTGFLRMDALSILLTMGNVCSHSNVLVVDMVNGLLTGAVAERLGGSGCVCSTYLGNKPYVTDIVQIFNFDSETKKSIRCAGLSDLLRPEKDESEMHLSVVDSEPSSLKVDNIEDGSLMPNDSSCRSIVHITQDDVLSCSSNFESNDEETSPSLRTTEETKLSLLPCSGKSKEVVTLKILPV